MGYLDELKRQADAAKAMVSVDGGAFERNALVTDAACRSTFRYFTTLAQQLNILQPAAKAEYRLDASTAFKGLRFTDFRADSRQRKLRDAEVFDHVVLAFRMKSGTSITLAKDFPPAIEKLESRLTQCGASYQSDNVRDPDTGKFVERRFAIAADFRGTVRLVPDHDSGWIQFQIANLDGFETVSVEFPAFEVGSARLDDLARWIVGEPNAFLRDGERLRRVEA
ncbi:MAG: hypothetical protein M3Z29_14515 [Pseudomonadota bacterium]|nr:hypothetical protein [Pseudomonadota bacterium]